MEDTLARQEHIAYFGSALSKCASCACTDHQIGPSESGDGSVRGDSGGSGGHIIHSEALVVAAPHHMQAKTLGGAAPPRDEWRAFKERCLHTLEAEAFDDGGSLLLHRHNERDRSYRRLHRPREISASERKERHTRAVQRRVESAGGARCPTRRPWART
eukprot:scaffold279819_cov37-Tisochrysis_lutea.AAC.1